MIRSIFDQIGGIFTYKQDWKGPSMHPNASLTCKVWNLSMGKCEFKKLNIEARDAESCGPKKRFASRKLYAHQILYLVRAWVALLSPNEDAKFLFVFKLDFLRDELQTFI